MCIIHSTDKIQRNKYFTLQERKQNSLILIQDKTDAWLMSLPTIAPYPTLPYPTLPYPTLPSRASCEILPGPDVMALLSTEFRSYNQSGKSLDIQIYRYTEYAYAQAHIPGFSMKNAYILVLVHVHRSRMSCYWSANQCHVSGPWEFCEMSGDFGRARQQLIHVILWKCNRYM